MAENEQAKMAWKRWLRWSAEIVNQSRSANWRRDLVAIGLGRSTHTRTRSRR